MRIYPSPARDFVIAALASETNDCILWPFAVRASSGYAAWQLPRGDGPRSVDVHRYVCAQIHGQPEPGEEAAHRCGNQTCINPRHIRWTTAHGNMEDAKQHGTLIGGGRYRQRLFAADRVKIAASKESLVTIAAIYGMSPSYMGKVRRDERRAAIGSYDDGRITR